jgi:hypothetical protein
MPRSAQKIFRHIAPGPDENVVYDYPVVVVNKIKSQRSNVYGGDKKKYETHKGRLLQAAALKIQFNILANIGVGGCHEASMDGASFRS